MTTVLSYEKYGLLCLLIAAVYTVNMHANNILYIFVRRKLIDQSYCWGGGGGRQGSYEGTNSRRPRLLGVFYFLR
jgi:hypothetical protein